MQRSALVKLDSTTAACSLQCGQILEALKGGTAKVRKLQIYALEHVRR